MAGFGWNYPPGVTGNEPQIAGYPEDEDAERGRDEVFEAAKVFAQRRGLEGAAVNRYAVGILTFIDLAEDGPEEDEVFHIAYTAGRRRGFGPAGAEQDAVEITNQVMSEWAAYLDTFARGWVVDQGPDPDELYEARRDRDMEDWD